MQTFGERLRRVRRARRCTMKDLAQLSGVPYMTIYRLESGIYSDTLTETAAKLSRALGVSLDVLAGVYEADLREDAAAPCPVGAQHDED
jgi:transcriptional regulator with XRE-family HTH domain